MLFLQRRNEYMKALTSLIAGAVLAGASLFFASPYWTLRQINQAYQRNDAAGMAEYIDFAQVKASLQPQIQQRLQDAAGLEHLPEPLQPWGGRLSAALSARAADAAVNQQTLMLLMQGKELKDAVDFDALLPAQDLAPPSRPASAAPAANQARVKAHYSGWNRFEIAVPADSGKLTRFEMARTGLHWKIVAVQLPD